MKRILAAAVLMLGLVTLVSAETKALPPGLMAWYKDVMVMYTGLVQGLDKATSAKEMAATLDRAAGSVRDLKLAVRYRDLKARYPEFFRQSDSGDPSWVPPAEWIKVSQEYAQALQTYSQGLQKAMTYASDPAVRQALKGFSAAMKELTESD